MARNKSAVVVILLLLSLFRVDITFAQHQVINAAPVKPVINNFTPATTGQSASVTINGASFTGTTSVSFGGAPAAAFVVISDNTIVATVGSGASGSISVTNAGGTTAATGFTFVSAPTISYQTPKIYNVNTAIAPLSPQNTGGPVPAGAYGRVTTFAGGASTSFYLPEGIATDAAGNLYIGDSGNALVRKITPAGQVSTFAGGTRGYRDGTGTAAQFGNTFGLAFDKDGNLYVCDELVGYIRKITPAGVVTTLAGNGQMGFANGKGTAASFNVITGVAVDHSGNVFVADQFNNMIRKITPDGTVTTFAGSGSAGFADGTGTSASFNNPIGIAIDAYDNLYVGDRHNNRIRKISPSGVVGTMAGNGFASFANGTAGAASFNQPDGIAVDAYGNLYIADALNNRIRKITPTGEVGTIAGNGQANSISGTGSSASFNNPVSISLNNAGDAFITEFDGNIVSKLELTGYAIDKQLPPGLTFDPTSGKITGTPTAASPSTDYTVTAYNLGGSKTTKVNITVIDNSVPVLPAPPKISYQTPQVYTINKAIAALAPKNIGGPVPANAYGQVSTFAGNGQRGSNDGQSSVATFYNPTGIVTDNAGNMFVADIEKDCVRKITPTGVVTTLSLTGLGKSQPLNPYGIAVDKSENLYLADAFNNTIWKITNFNTISVFAGGTQGSADGKGVLAQFNHPGGVLVDNTGNIYVADTDNHSIRKIDQNGVVSTFVTSLDYPMGMAIDAQGVLYVVDAGEGKIKKITPDGSVSLLAGGATDGSHDGIGITAGFVNPQFIVLDKLGNVYVTDSPGNLIKKITPAGVVTTLAGTASPGFNNGAGNLASFNNPIGITIDNAGNLFVVDNENYVIREIIASGYTIDKPLPAGLTFDPTTGAISGTPTVTSPATDYTVTAYNTGGSSSTVVNITVIDNIVTVLPAPPKINYQTPQVYTIKTPITPLPPTNTGGAVPATTYGQVVTIAGVADVSGSTNGAVLSSTFKEPFGILKDKAGNIYVADQGNNIIRKITPAGVVSTFAGTGAPGSANGAGTAASFYHPSALAIDASGNIYVADSGNNLLRKITPAGVVSTLAGGGLDTFSDGQGTNANFFGITGLGIDAGGNLFAAETIDQLIRKITPGGLVSSYAGKNGTAGFRNDVLSVATFSQPSGVVVDGDGNIYIADYNNNAIRKITPDGMVSTLAGGAFGSADGTGTQAKFAGPISVGADAPGNIYVADQGNNIIRKITPAGVVTTIAGREGTFGAADGIGIAATLNFPTGIFVDIQSGDVYFTDAGSHLVRKIVTTGYTIDKPLPPGLTFDPTTGIISGTPTAPSLATDYTVTAYNIGGSSSTVVNITVLDLQSVTFGPLPPKTVCDADFDPGATGNSAITYTSDNPAVATIVNNKIHITGAGTSVITATDGTSTVTQPLTVTSSVTPTINIVLGTVDCIGLPLTYQADITDAGSNPVYQWQVNGQNAGENNHTFTSSDLKTGDKITCILTSNTTCTTQATVTSNEVTVTLPDPVVSSITITSSETTPVCAGTPITFTATSVNPGDKPRYEWQVNGVDQGGDNSTFTSSNLNDGDVVTCILHASVTCQVDQQAGSNSITVTLNPVSQCIIVIPNTFTPNGDGINDLWNITALTYHPECLVRVFNRYGQQVFESKGYNKPWDGTNNNSTLPTGTYYYIIDLKNGTRPLGGYVAIVH